MTKNEFSVLFVAFDQLKTHVNNRAEKLLNRSGNTSVFYSKDDAQWVAKEHTSLDSARPFTPKTPDDIFDLMNELLSKNKIDPDIIFLSEITEMINTTESYNWNRFFYTKVIDNSHFARFDTNRMAVYKKSSVANIKWNRVTQSGVNIMINDTGIIGGIHVPNKPHAENTENARSFLSKQNANFLIGDFNINFNFLSGNNKKNVFKTISNKHGGISCFPAVEMSFHNVNLIFQAKIMDESSPVNAFQHSNSSSNKHIVGFGLDKTGVINLIQPVTLIPDYFYSNTKSKNIVFSDHPPLYAKIKV